MARLNALILCLASLAGAVPHQNVKRQITELRDKYDFIIAGGGTCGLVVANRLTEAFPDKTVLVIEYGQIEYAPGGFDPPQTVWGGQNPNQASTWSFSSLPNTEVKNKTASVFAGKVVGGSSAVNGMFFDRGSRFDYDAWDQVGSPEFDSHKVKWNWKEIFPYFKKSVTFTEPLAATVDKYNYTWDSSVYGNTTPIYSSLPPFLWGDHPILRDAFKDMAIPTLRECGAGDKNGVCWIHISQHPQTARRSHAGLGHYADVNTTRPNYDLLVRHQVTRLTFPNGLTAGPPTVEFRSLNTNKYFNLTPKAEVILAAGAFHTPTILHRSGIGPSNTLQAANITPILNLPGVGNNFQDHSGPSISWSYTTPPSLPDLPSLMSTASFAAEALAGFNAVPARGPYTLSMANTALYLPLPEMIGSFGASLITDKIRAMVANGTSASYLPASYRSSPEMIAGYNAQLLVTADFLDNVAAPSTEVPWATGTSARVFILHPLSRGTVTLNTTHPLEQPILDYRTGSNPIDFDLHNVHLRAMWELFGTKTMKRYGAVPVGLGLDVMLDDDKLTDYVKDTMTFSFMHPCCTAAMMPRNKGGVVGPDLKVHGLVGVRVVDMSVLPLLPSAHLSATAYAVGEKAADVIVQEWKEKKW